MKNFFDNIKNSFNKKNNEPVFGTVTIKDGNVSVKNPIFEAGVEKLPVLSIPTHPNLTVLINGKAVTGEVFVSHEDEITLSIEEPVIRSGASFFTSFVSDDRMTVYMKKEIKMGEKWSIQDVNESQKAEITITSVPFLPELGTVDEIKTQLETEGFEGEYMMDNIQMLCEAKDTIELDVLKGKLPFEGIAAKYNLIFQQSSINFIPKNEIIAILEPEIPAVDGVDVFGNLLPIELKYKLPSLGSNVHEEEGVLKAKKDGRLIFDENQIEVIPQLVIQGDLNESDGPIIFGDGDIVIEGRVLEKSFIKASGSIFAKDGIYGATVISDGSVYVNGNISSSKVYAGIPSLLYLKASRFLNTLRDKVDHMQFSSSVSYINSKYVSEMFSIFELIENQIDEKTRLFYHDLLVFKNETESSLLHLKKKDTAEVDHETLELLKENLKILISRMNMEKSDILSEIKSDNVTNSTLYASGEIEITGAGTYLSFMESAKFVKVKGKVNGGTILAETFIEVNEFKSYNTTDFGLIVFDEKGYIKIVKRHPDTTIKVSDKKNTTFDTEFNVMFKYFMDKH